MNLLLEEYKILSENYRNNIDQAAIIARFYTGTTLLLLGGIFGKLAFTKQAELEITAIYIYALVLILIFWSIQALIMMNGIFKSRVKTINRLNKLRVKLFENESFDVNIGYNTKDSIKTVTTLTYLAFGAYPLLVIVLSICLLVKLF